MASLFFPTCKYPRLLIIFICFSIVGIVVYYIIVCLYLFGDLAIYAVAAPTSVAKVVW